MFTEPPYGYFVWITSPPRAEQRSPLLRAFWLDRSAIILFPVHLNLILICEKILEKK
jgi:hypothetical protein